ncbi:MAG: hypothetical protein HY336_02530 [Candidatus Doudnabacteria bacterium]|nr:hypothetical protein [Candidatus Doudnabacteria bacterium]
MMQFILSNKPVLVGLHLGFAILGIDLLLWLAGEVAANVRSNVRMKWVSLGAVLSFILSWLVGGYYYVKYYGPIVKPIIKAGSAPWAHAIAMEAKEHIFLFIVPMAVTLFLLSQLKSEEVREFNLRSSFLQLSALAAGLGLLLGLMGFVISAAARWS